jgi:hypothetical protein
MTITYGQAGEIVRNYFRPRWVHGTFCVDDREIVENDEFYIFTVGPHEYLVDNDESFEVIGSSVPVVYKADGRLDFKYSPFFAIDESMRRRPNPDSALKG